jgi:hypothetical protein
VWFCFCDFPSDNRLHQSRRHCFFRIKAAKGSDDWKVNALVVVLSSRFFTGQFAMVVAWTKIVNAWHSTVPLLYLYMCLWNFDRSPRVAQDLSQDSTYEKSWQNMDTSKQASPGKCWYIPNTLRIYQVDLKHNENIERRPIYQMFMWYKPLARNGTNLFGFDIFCTIRNHKQSPKQTINQPEKPRSIASYKDGGCIDAVHNEV